MNKPLLFTSAVFLLMFSSASIPARALQDAVSTPARARQLYVRDCAMCHGANGDGKTDIAKDRQLIMPDWTDPKSFSGRTDQQLFTLIRRGKGPMPAESEGRANKDDLNSMIQYIRAMAKDRPATTPAAPKATIQ